MTGAEVLAALRVTVTNEEGEALASRIAGALEAIGWRAGDLVEPEEVAREVMPAITACARQHGDVALMYRQVAEVLRGCGPLLDGGLPPVSDYIPAAAEVVRAVIRTS